MTRQQAADFIFDKYGVKPEFLWKEFPEYEVFRHQDNDKWFAIIMNVKESKLGLSGNAQIDVIDVKCDPNIIGSLLEEKGFFKAYHMNKEHWISIALAEVEGDKTKHLIETSFNITADEE